MRKCVVEKLAMIRKTVSGGGIVALSMFAMMLAGCASNQADDGQVTESQDANVSGTETQVVTETVNYEVRDNIYFYRDDTQIGTFEVYENCDFATSLDEFISVLYMSDASFSDEKELASEGKYTLTYAELSVQQSAAMETEGADTEWHYYIHDGGNFFVDVTLDSKDESTDELEEYLESYMKSLAD